MLDEKVVLYTLTITATAAVLYLLGNWVGRSFGLNRQQVIRNIHEAYGRATDAFEAGQTKDLTAFFRHELDEVNLKQIKFRLDTVSLHSDSIVLKTRILRYFSVLSEAIGTALYFRVPCE